MAHNDDFDRLIDAGRKELREARASWHQREDETHQAGERIQAYGRYAAQLLLAAHVPTEQIKRSKMWLSRTAAEGWILEELRLGDPGDRLRSQGLILCTSGDFCCFNGAERIDGTLVSPDGVTPPLGPADLGGYSVREEPLERALTYLLAGSLPDPQRGT